MKIPLPQRGQPIDIDYLYQIVSQINTLTNQISSTSTVLSAVDNGVNGIKESTTNNLRFYAFTKSVKKGNVTAGASESWFIDFNPSFIYIPIVTATPVNNSSSPAGNSLSVVIKNVSTSRVDGSIIFNQAGQADVNINVIAIGTT
jgi:hypothetical protein